MAPRPVAIGEQDGLSGQQVPAGPFEARCSGYVILTSGARGMGQAGPLGHTEGVIKSEEGVGVLCVLSLECNLFCSLIFFTTLIYTGLLHKLFTLDLHWQGIFDDETTPKVLVLEAWR